jgi:hypothetical protein
MYKGVNGDSLKVVTMYHPEFLSLLSPRPSLLLVRTVARYTFESKASIVVALPILDAWNI